MKFILIKKNSGFTLVEILMYMGILTFLLLILTQILTSILGVQLESEATSSVQQDGRFILSRLVHDINHAENIAVPATPSAQTSALELIINGSSNIYSLSGENFVIANSFGSNNLNSYGTTVSNLSFRRLGNVGGKNTITVSFTMASVVRLEQGPEVEDFLMTAGVR